MTNLIVLQISTGRVHIHTLPCENSQRLTLVCDCSKSENYPNREASNIPSVHHVQGPRRRLSNLLVACDPLPWWPYRRRVSGSGGQSRGWCYSFLVFLTSLSASYWALVSSSHGLTATSQSNNTPTFLLRLKRESHHEAVSDVQFKTYYE